MAPFPPLVLLLLGMAALLPRVAAVDILQAGGDLPVNSFLQAGMFYLVMQEDCNLVIYMGDQCCTNWSAGDQCCATWDATWATGTWDRGASGDGCFASMQQDRNFVVYGSINNVNTALWATNTYLDLANATGAYYVQLRSDGVLALMEIGSTQVIWSNVGRTPVQAPAPAPISAGPPAPPGTLTPDSQSVTNTTFMLQGNYVQNGSFLVNGDFKLILEQNCNLQSKNVVTGDVLWETASSSSLGACELFLQKNSTLEIRIGSSEESIIWKSNETNPGNADASLLALTENGTVEVCTKDLKVIWTMPSSPPPPMPSSPPPPMPSSPPPPMPSSPPPPMPSSPPPPDPPGGTAGPGLMIAGITGGVLVGSILLGVTLYCALRHYGYFDKAKKELQQRLQNKGGRARALTLHQVRKATNNNERLLGIGGFGPVYYGRLQDGQEVAVKALSATSKQGKQEFFNEIELLSVVHHKYLVSLVGYCIQWKQSILVYEYMSGGDLRDRLHGEESSAAPLSWNHRKNIILQVAEGIQYLHEGCKPAIIHRDIKTNNILLDKRMVAKVADFGLSKLLHIDRDDRDATHITTAVKGTTGYLDPEYYVTQKLTEKSDVYAYGVLLMEIITGRPLLDKTDHMYIVHKVRTAWKSKDLDGLADPNLEGNYDHEEFSGLVKLSLWCVKQSSSGRPSMSQVVHVLREIGMVQAGTSHPSIPVPEAVAGADYLGISMPYPSETGSSSANPKTDMSDPLISAFSTSSSSATRTGGKA